MRHPAAPPYIVFRTLFLKAIRVQIFLSMIYQLSLFGTLQLKKQQQHCASLSPETKVSRLIIRMQVSGFKFGSVTA